MWAAMSSVALVVWLEMEPGPLRDFAFNVMLVGGVSTVLFNGNPLLRFDGYYVLCDALEIPNLGLRSTRYLGYLVQRYLGGAREAVSPVGAPGEGFWFFLYGLASFFYRVAILVAIVLFVAGVYLPAGIVLGVWAAISQWLLPAVRGLKRLIGAPVLAGRRVRTASMLAVPVAAASVASLGVPVPAWTCCWRATRVLSSRQAGLVVCW